MLKIDGSEPWISIFLFLVYFAITCGNVRGEAASDFRTRNAIVKIIQDESGDLYDCYDINRQPSFNNPLLKDHKVQKKPSRFPHYKESKRLRKPDFDIQLSALQCPLGTVPIRRIINRERLEHYQHNYHLTNSSKDVASKAFYYAGWGTKYARFYGGQASLNIYGINAVKSPQESGAFLWITDDKSTDDNDVIGVGWLVAPHLYNDNEPRLTIYCHVTGKGGWYNFERPGYVQVDSKIKLGSKLPKSTFLKQQSYITLSISRDPKTHFWWLLIGDDAKPVGYWHHGLFPALAAAPAKVVVGGFAASPPNLASPPMGSGHFPSKGFAKSTMVKNILAMNEKGKWLSPTPWFNDLYNNKPDCYKVNEPKDDGPGKGLNFIYGGSGGCTS